MHIKEKAIQLASDMLSVDESTLGYHRIRRLVQKTSEMRYPEFRNPFGMRLL